MTRRVNRGGSIRRLGDILGFVTSLQPRFSGRGLFNFRIMDLRPVGVGFLITGVMTLLHHLVIYYLGGDSMASVATLHGEV